jgi:7-cyano-7-deazaguanine synthase in queuosine biosynthesis
MTESVNVVVGKRIPQSVRRTFTIDDPLRLVLHDERSNVRFSFAEIEKTVGTTLDSLVKDLLDIAVAIYMSDQYIERETNLSRAISIVIPVRNPTVWNAAKAMLVQTVAFLIQNKFDIHFIEGDPEPSHFRPYDPRDSAKCVCLLSGGLDSLVGALWLVEQGKAPFFVSHWSSGRLKGFQDDVRRFLTKVLKKKLRHCQVHIVRTEKHTRFKLGKAPEQLMVQFSRSFLYLSLAAAVALTLKLRDIYICENGPIAINVPLSEARLNTRTVHPMFLHLYKQFIQEVFGVSISVINPFLYKTKGEVVSKLSEPRFTPLIKLSCSCWKYSQVANIAQRRGRFDFEGCHCGECCPCIMRQIALHAAKISRTSDDDYLLKVFEDYPPQDTETITLLLDLLRFVHDVKHRGIEDTLVKYPDFSMDVDDIDPIKLVEMYQRFANETITTFNALGNRIIQQKYGFLLK